MAWRWYNRIRIFGGLNANLSSNGVGWSWGIGFVRIGISPDGRRWVSIGVPGTGLRYFKYLKRLKNAPQQERPLNSEDKPKQPKAITKWKDIK